VRPTAGKLRLKSNPSFSAPYLIFHRFSEEEIDTETSLFLRFSAKDSKQILPQMPEESNIFFALNLKKCVGRVRWEALRVVM
jgi:hypothetical protein